MQRTNSRSMEKRKRLQGSIAKETENDNGDKIDINMNINIHT